MRVDSCDQIFVAVASKSGSSLDEFDSLLSAKTSPEARARRVDVRDEIRKTSLSANIAPGDDEDDGEPPKDSEPQSMVRLLTKLVPSGLDTVEAARRGLYVNVAAGARSTSVAPTAG